MNKASISTNKKGMTSLNRGPSLIFAIPQTTKRQRPIGGVRSPIIRLTTTISPKWSGLIPSWVTRGIRIGTIRIKAASQLRFEILPCSLP
jgi:hypothetical protein